MRASMVIMMTNPTSFDDLSEDEQRDFMDFLDLDNTVMEISPEGVDDLDWLEEE